MNATDGPGRRTAARDAECGWRRVVKRFTGLTPKDIQLKYRRRLLCAPNMLALAELKAIAGRNKRFTSYIGMGHTAVQLPPVILRATCWKTCAGIPPTPCQPEVSQGRLEALLNFQQVTLTRRDWTWLPPPLLG